MQPSKQPVHEFLHTVCEQVKCRKLHPSLSAELESHIYDQAEEYQNGGMEESAAVTKAICSMGDPVLVGKQLNQAHKASPEWSIIILTALLVLAGFFLQTLLGSNGAAGRYAMVALLSAPVIAFLYVFDYTRLSKHWAAVFLALVVVSVVFFLLTPRTHGRYAHVSEFVLLFCPVFALAVYRLRAKRYFGVLLCTAVYFVAAVLCILTPSVLALAILTGTFLTVMSVSIAKGWFGVRKPIAFGMIFTPFLPAVFALLPRLDRLQILLNPETDPHGDGYVGTIVHQVLSHSNLWGPAGVLAAPFESAPLETVLPGWNNDFILTYLIGQYGYLAGIAVVALFAFFVWRMFAAALRQKTTPGLLLALSATTALALQGVVFIAVNLGFTITTATLPLFSSGSVGFLVSSVLVGIVLSVFKQTNIVRETNAASTQNSPFFQYQNGQLIINLKSK